MLNLVALTAAAMAVTVCGGMLAAIVLDRQEPTPARHRPHAAQPLPSDEPGPEPVPKPFDPLDESIPLAEVERFLAGLEVSAAATCELETVQ